MNKYILLGWCGGMGGGNIYTMNKCEATRLTGWTPIVIHSDSRDVFLDYLKEYQDNLVKELDYLPCYFTRNRQKRVIDHLVDIVNPLPGDSFFVESNGVRSSYWGELLAKRLNCKHFTFFLEYYFPWQDDNMDYLEFKRRRCELSGVSKLSVKQLFNNDESISYDDIPIMHASCANSVENVEDPLNVDYSSFDIIIGNIGRSSKPYVESLASGIRLFAEKHYDKRILFINIGGDKDSQVAKNQQYILKGVANLECLNTGYLFPIPQCIINQLDIAIASGGCIGIAVRSGIKTIAFADQDDKPFGVVGYDLRNINLQMNKHCGLSLCDLLEGVLFGSYCDNFEYVQLYDAAPSHDSIMNVLKKDIEIMTAPRMREYFDTTKVYPLHKVYKLYIRTIGRFMPISSILRLKQIKVHHKHSTRL